MTEQEPHPPIEPEGSDGVALGRLEAELAATHRQLMISESELAAARQREELLRSELQHRLRNMLAVVRSIFSRTVAAAETLEDAADHFRGRLDVLARYQQGRVRDISPSVDFETMIRDELQDFSFGDDARITMSGPELALSVDAAQLVALALHELVTNALKFGALSRDSGRLAITWRNDDGRLCLVWAESGVSIVASAPLRRGFGREFIEQALPYQLSADVAFTLRAGGIHCTITLPLAAARPAA